jgi:hypothetical protein
MSVFRKDRRAHGATAAIGVASPWADGGNLGSLVLSDVYGTDIASRLPMSRGEALSIPAVSRARHLITSSIAQLPLVALSASGPLAVQPSWLYRSDSDVSPYSRLASTVDDLLFFGVSLWAVKRGADGYPLDAAWIPADQWTITDGNILVNDEPADEQEVILFDVPGFSGLLNVASRTLRGAIAIENAWVSRVKNPVPLSVIKSTDQVQLEQSEIDTLLRTYNAARRSEDGSTAYLPPNLELEDHGTSDPELYIAGRNSIRTDIASHLNIPTILLDGSPAEATLNYVTQDGTRSRFYAETIPFWLDPIVQRLSLDDCVPRGQRVRADFTEQLTATPTPTGAPVVD